MQVLIQNYATSRSTEPLYFSETLNEVGVRAILWQNPEVGAFDMFDTVQPSLFVTNYKLITNDIIKYLATNPGIDCVINVTDATQQHIDTVVSVFANNRISCPFMFTNYPKELNTLIGSTIPIVSIMHGVDCYLPSQNIDIPDYNIQLGVFTDTPESASINEVTNGIDTYHKISYEEDSQGGDIIATAMHLYPLFGKYDQCVIIEEDYVPQSFFDSLFYGNETYLISKLKPLKSMGLPDNILRGDSSPLPSVGEVDFTSIKATVRDKHTCHNRVSSILDNLKCSDLSKKVHKLKEALV